MKIMATSLQRSHAHTATPSALNPVAGHPRPMPPLETPGHPQASLGQSLVGSVLLSPGSWCTQGFICVLQVSISQSYVSSGGSMVGLMVTSSKRAYAIRRSAAPRAPAPAAGTLQETLKTQLHPSTKIWIKDLLSMPAPPTPDPNQNKN